MDSELSALKFSMYNNKLEKEGQFFIYNALTGGYAKIDKQFHDLFSKCDISNSDNINVLKSLPSDILKKMQTGGFLIPKEMDEIKMLKTMHYQLRFGTKNSLGLTILPTLNCNFRCPYCYEKDKAYPVNEMSTEVMDAIIDYVDSNISEGGALSVSWYGGEPLIKFDLLKILQNRLLDLTQRKKITMVSSIITNGYLLTREVSDKLVELGITRAQVTLDGPEEIHNNTRYLVNGKGTYDRIISNLKNINKGLFISIRVNLQKENIKYVPEFLDSLIDAGFREQENIKPYFATVHDYEIEKGYISSQCFSIADYSKEEIEINKIMEEKGFMPDPIIAPRVMATCGAVSSNALIIEPDGTIQKCWNVVGDKKESVGNILDVKKTEQNKILKLVNESKWYSWSPFDNRECLKCSVLPLCMGGCPFYTVNYNKLFDEFNYKCISYKYNLTEILQEIASKHINENLYKSI